MKTKMWLEKIGVGGLIFLLPFFALPMATGEMESQFDMPKRLAAFLLGNLCFSLFLSRRVSVFYGLAHLGFVSACFFSGFGFWQVYPCLFEIAAVMTGLWFVELQESDRIFYLKIVALSGLVCCLQAYLQTFGFTWPLHFAEGIAHDYPIAFLGQQTKFGAFAALISTLCLALCWYPCAVFAGFCALITGSSFTYLSLGVGILVVLRHKIGLRTTLVLASAGVLALGVLYLAKPDMDAFAGNGRLNVWKETIACAKERPLIGFGPGGFHTVFDSHCENWRTRERYGKFAQAHNDYLQVLFDGGRIGVACLVIVLFGIFLAYWQTWIKDRHIREFNRSWDRDYLKCFIDKKSVHAAQGILAALMANAVGNFPWQLSPHYVLGLISGGILLHELKQVAIILPIWPQPIYSFFQTLRRRFASIWEPRMIFPWRRRENTSTAP